MEGVEREDEVMCKTDSYVSPYLRRPRRSYAEVMRDAAVKSAQANGGKRGAASGIASNRVDDEGAASRVSKQDRRRESEARR